VDAGDSDAPERAAVIGAVSRACNAWTPRKGEAVSRERSVWHPLDGGSRNVFEALPRGCKLTHVPYEEWLRIIRNGVFFL
jgi:hypothetical protein